MSAAPFWVLVLFFAWSNSFIAIAYLLGTEGAPARFDWFSLTAARFLVSAAACAAYCLAFRRAESWAILRRRWRRLALAGLCCVPGYNFALYYGQQHGVPAPVASLETAMAPLFLMLLGAAFLGERLSGRKLLGFAVAFSGLWIISRARAGEGGTAYPWLVAVTALAPLCWSTFSALTKPVSGECSPTLWTFLAISAGTLALLPGVALRGLPELAALDGRGWAALLFLSLPCTVFGFAVWGWLLRRLPASSLGFTIFLNPPFTTASKAAWAWALPGVFAFSISAQEWLGGAVVLLGMAIAVWKIGRISPR